MIKPLFGRRDKFRIQTQDFQHDITIARDLYRRGEFNRSFDVYEQLVAAYPDYGTALLAELFECYKTLPQRDRYSLYQSRHFDFGIKPGDKVLDIGSGHIPFPLATHLSDITLTDHGYGRAGVPFKKVDGKPVYECSVEEMPFGDREFDFVYCSHVLEHAANPEQACRELMRVAKRGFIECPSPGKDIFLNSARISNHSWGVEAFEVQLIFSEYSPEQIEAFECDILQQMHSAPQTDREKALSALIYLKANVVNTMLLWDGSFDYEVRRRGHARVTDNGFAAPAQEQTMPLQATATLVPEQPVAAPAKPLKFLQVHTFYPMYLDDFYTRIPNLAQASFADQIDALMADAFSGIHMFAPYMDPYGYDSHLVVANNPYAQEQWLKENGAVLTTPHEWVYEVVRRQIEAIKPDILYLSDPITFDSRFIATLGHIPKLVLGWRAANIPEITDWSAFDVILTSLATLREVALKLGASAAEHFFPGYPTWVNKLIDDVTPQFDVVFSGQWTLGQHPGRNRYLQQLAGAAAIPKGGFSLGLYLSGQVDTIPQDVAGFNLGGHFGVSMHRALKTGRIALDARGVLEIKNTAARQVTDLAGRQTANMRIFEVTGGGVFLLSEHHDNLSDYFEPGVEIETFRDEREMVDKVHYYLAHPEKREAIARRGQERCLSDYSMEKRAAELDRIIRTHLARKYPAKITTDSTSISAETVSSLRNRAVELLEISRHIEAFDVLVRAKALKQPLQGLDYLRAICFTRINQPASAREALQEELRWFPDNTGAQELLDHLLKQSEPQGNAGADDAEFRQLLQEIRPYTMLSTERLYTLFTLAKEVCERNLPGNFVECGVAAGGSSALLAYVIKRYSKVPRRLFSFDSFSGMPEPTAVDTHAGQAADDTGWGTGTCAAPEESVREICTKLGVVDVLTTVKGYFEDTLPEWRDRVGMIALLHLDGDWYESTRAILCNLYDRIINDGLMQVDDYGHWEGCRKAIHEFEEARGVKFAVSVIDSTGVWFPKPDHFLANPLIPRSTIGLFNEIDPVPMGIEGQMSPNERFQLFHALRELLPHRANPLRFVEVGSFAGGSLLLSFLTLKKMGFRIQGFSVDPGRHPSLLKVLDLTGPDISFLQMFSHEAAPRLAQVFTDGNYPECIFIDGDHTYEGVRRDILDYWPMLAPGGIMLLHDWLPPLDNDNREAIFAHHGGQEPGIRQACSEILEEMFGVNPLELPLLYPTDPTQTQAHIPIIPCVFSTVRAYRKPIDG